MLFNKNFYSDLEMTPILDCSIHHHAIQTIPIGGQDFDEYFHSLLLSDSQFIKEYGETPDIDIARALKESDICEVLLDTGNLEDKPVRMVVEYHGKKVCKAFIIEWKKSK
jgi:actin-related protein